MDVALRVVLVGVGATLLMDLWGVVRRPLFGFARLDYAMLGRWFGHMVAGRFRHDAIARSPPIGAERWIGVAVHYLIGIGFAAVLVVMTGVRWLEHPTLIPALLVGVITVVAPLLIMQPAMGAGVAARRTPRPTAARLQSLLTHAIYGLGLYLAGVLARLVLGS